MGERLKPLVSYGEFPVRFLLLCLFLRGIDLIWVRSYFVPDEYWQSLEVAHKQAFGYGYLTWEWIEGIRSYLYVSLFTVIFKILKFLELDTQELVVLTPRILQAIFSALGDVYFVRWVAEKRNGQYAWAFFSWITCTFISYCSTRTLMNTLEMNLTSIALYYYPWSPKSKNLTFVFIVALSCFLRPTAAVTWLPLVITNVLANRSPLVYFFKNYVSIGLLVAAACVGFDSYMHGSFVITPWNFFKFNVLNNIGSFYGTHDFVWYLYCGIPVVLGLQAIPFYLAAYNASKKLRDIKYSVEAQMVASIGFSVLIFSLSPHKEFRFLLPIMPMMIYLSSGILSRWSVNAKFTYIYALGALLISVHMTALIFLGQFHQMGPLDTVSRLGPMARNNTKADILYLAPCHSFPGYSHLHANVSTRHLECKPNLEGLPDYEDEAAQFYNNTNAWLRREYATTRPCILPTHIVKFNTLNITNFLYINNYTLSLTVFNSYYFPENAGDKIEIYRRRGPKC